MSSTSTQKPYSQAPTFLLLFGFSCLGSSVMRLLFPKPKVGGQGLAREHGPVVPAGRGGMCWDVFQGLGLGAVKVSGFGFRVWGCSYVAFARTFIFMGFSTWSMHKPSQLVCSTPCFFRLVRQGPFFQTFRILLICPTKIIRQRTLQERPEP